MNFFRRSVEPMREKLYLTKMSMYCTLRRFVTCTCTSLNDVFVKHEPVDVLYVVVYGNWEEEEEKFNGMCTCDV